MSIKERMKLVISAKTRDRSRYVQLKEQTGISGDIWKNFWFDRREPDALMLEALGRAWPEFAYWMVTGATNVGSGHLCPSTAFCFEGQIAALITSEAFLKAGVDVAREVELAVKATPEEEDQIYEAIHSFMKGGFVHQIPSNIFDPVDQIFKKIKALNQIAKVMSKETEVHSHV